jgi:hypothetical protein
MAVHTEEEGLTIDVPFVSAATVTRLKRGAEVDRGTIADAVVLAGAHELALGSPGDAVLCGFLPFEPKNEHASHLHRIFFYQPNPSTPAIEAQSIGHTTGVGLDHVGSVA